jgi:PI31 proteasome regulator N-terminal/PI31 proteasome regulator
MTTPSAQDALSAASILSYMTKSLPQSSESQSPKLKDAYAAVALFSHACMCAVGFRLIGLGEDHKIETQSSPEDAQPLPSEWDASSSYAFRYAHSQSSMEYVIKVLRLGNKALISGLALDHDKTASFEIKAQDYISEGSLQNQSSEADIKSALGHIFISPGRITDLASLFRSSIIQKLAPGIHKAGYEDTTSTSTVTDNPRRQEQDNRPPLYNPLRDDRQDPARPNPYPYADPLAAPRRPHPAGDFPPPGFDDEYDVMRPPRGMRPGQTPFGNIGERDLYPPGLGPNDPLRMGPGGSGFRGGGMHPTFDDPMFGGQGGQGGGYDPMAPPGARYDPVGPGDGRPQGRMGGGPRFPGGPGSSPGNPFSGYGSGDFI